MPNLQFSATYTGRSPASLSYVIAGVSGASLPPSIYVAETSAFTYNNSSGGLTIFGLQDSTSYVFTLEAAGYDSITTATQATQGIQSIRGSPPVLYSGPANQTRAAGEITMFAVAAAGGLTQWYKNGTAIPDVSAGTYITMTAADGDTFYAILTNDAGSVSTGPATFTLATVPTITAQPTAVTVAAAGNVATFSVSASGTAPLTYQWQLNGTNITGATGMSYTANAVNNGDAYRVIVTNLGGTVTSNSVALTIDPNAIICFLADAPVLTPRGYRRIDSLRPGDKVTTADGRVVPIVRVAGSRPVAGPHSNPYCIPRGKFGATEDVWVSPRHRLAIGGGRMVEARNLGLEQAKMEGIITYYNLELPDWERDNLVVAGVEAESMASVRRRVISMAEFTAIMQRHRDVVTSERMQQILRVCRILPGGRIEYPYVKR